MRLSEAIRLGAMLKPQGVDFITTYRDAPSTTCALGAALDASGALTPEFVENASTTAFFARCEELWPWVGERLECCRQCPMVTDRRTCHNNWLHVADFITHLNDVHRWTRERIADWVETLESERHRATELAPSEAAVAGTVVVSTSGPRA